MRDTAARTIAIAAGGTGGHLFPAEALAATLLARGHRVVLFTDARSGALASPVFAELEQHLIPGAGLAGRSPRQQLAAIVGLARGVAIARAELGRLAPAALVAFGGYPSIPPVLAARTRRRRPAIILHEGNAVLGRANRALARFADGLALGFPTTTRVPATGRTTITGNPVRPAIAALATRPYTPPSGTVRLLILGGSLGARIFSTAIPTALAALPEPLRQRLRITQQVRAEDLPRVRDAYAALGMKAQLAPFFTNIAEHIAAADLLIARAGASTCAEILTAGLPAILVPLPTAIDDHQAANARFLADAGAASVVPESELARRLPSLLTDYLAAPAPLAAMAAAARAACPPEPAAALADLVERCLEQVP